MGTAWSDFFPRVHLVSVPLCCLPVRQLLGHSGSRVNNVVRQSTNLQARQSFLGSSWIWLLECLCLCSPRPTAWSMWALLGLRRLHEIKSSGIHLDARQCPMLLAAHIFQDNLCLGGGTFVDAAADGYESRPRSMIIMMPICQSSLLIFSVIVRP